MVSQQPTIKRNGLIMSPEIVVCECKGSLFFLTGLPEATEMTCFGLVRGPIQNKISSSHSWKVARWERAFGLIFPLKKSGQEI